ncbi:DUF3857 domain-containing protein [Pedobacter caeni]|uniref:DUF3857 domain-containing protein n=1 Tax=Pedobacter caeni TaxID=288992 RepID=A0A1M4T0Y5_9SPHI|nr:DUF3857 domain-containing protein [Pedobacter caeni]SHE37927.1 Protein of unknown function [Pedobacter caeni]
MRSTTFHINIKMPLLAFLCFIAISTASGQGKNFSIDRKDPSWTVKADRKGASPPAKDISDGYFLSLYENQNHVELQEEYTHIIREIVSDAGVQNGSEVSVTYEPGFQKLIFHKILLWRNNQSTDLLQSHKFKVLQTEKDLSKFIYSGTYDAFLLLDDVRKGDRIEYAYTIKGNNPIFGQKHATQLYFEGASSVGHLYTNMIFSKSRSFQMKNFNFNNGPKVSEKDGLTLYEWESRLTKTHRVTDFEPSWYSPLRRTQLTEYKNWNEVVNWGLMINDYPNLNSPLLDKKVQELKAKSGNKPDKYLELATRFVQDEIRYMGIEVGQYSHKPNSPEKVMKQRYGDCKDKSLLLVHLLAPMNISAYMAYADTYTTVKTNETLPSPFAFNHVVVLVEHQQKKIWIDPTISYQRGPVDQIYFPDYGYALVVKKGVNALERVISKPTGKQVAKLSFTLPDTTADQQAKLLIKTTYTGQYADNMRSELAETGTDDLEKSYLEYYSKLYTNISQAGEIVIRDNDATNTLEVTESYEISDIWATDADDGRPYVSFVADMISHEMRNIPAKARTAPLSLKSPVNIEQFIEIITPERWNMDINPVTVDNDYFFFESNGHQKDKTLTLSYTFRGKKAFINGSEVKSYVKARAKVLDHLSYYISWGPAATAGIGNPFLVIITIITLVISVIYALKIYQSNSPYSLEEIQEAKPIRGWLILLSIQAVLLPFGLLARVMSFRLWDHQVWKGLTQESTLLEYSVKGMLILQAISFGILLCASILGIFLLFNRRKSFSALYIPFLFGYICFLILNCGIYWLLKDDIGISPVKTEISRLIGSMIFSLLWILYLKKSVRVEETFVFPYSELEWRTEMMKHYNHQATAKRQDNTDHENI